MDAEVRERKGGFRGKRTGGDDAKKEEAEKG